MSYHHFRLISALKISAAPSAQHTLSICRRQFRFRERLPPLPKISPYSPGARNAGSAWTKSKDPDCPIAERVVAMRCYC